MRHLNRVVPRIGPENYKTYQLLAPVATHRKPATCEVARCEAFMNGWKTLIDESSLLGQAQAHYIRKQSGRKFVEDREGELTAFVFEAGQRCFREHTISVGRDPLFLVKDGDFRGNPRGTRARRHVRPADWVEDFAEHQDSIAEVIRRG